MRMRRNSVRNQGGRQLKNVKMDIKSKITQKHIIIYKRYQLHN